MLIKRGQVPLFARMDRTVPMVSNLARFVLSAPTPTRPELPSAQVVPAAFPHLQSAPLMSRVAKSSAHLAVGRALLAVWARGTPFSLRAFSPAAKKNLAVKNVLLVASRRVPAAQRALSARTEPRLLTKKNGQPVLASKFAGTNFHIFSGCDAALLSGRELLVISG